MQFYEILVILLVVIFLSAIIGSYIYKKIKHQPTGECACCRRDKKNALVRAYHKKYGKVRKS